jgi:hypothetical protein
MSSHRLTQHEYQLLCLGRVGYFTTLLDALLSGYGQSRTNPFMLNRITNPKKQYFSYDFMPQEVQKLEPKAPPDMHSPDDLTVIRRGILINILARAQEEDKNGNTIEAGILFAEVALAVEL